MRTIKSFKQLRQVVEAHGMIYVRWSKFPAKDIARGYSLDHASGSRHAGLSVNRLTAEMDDVTLVSRILEYSYLEVSNPGLFAWLLVGDEAGRDSDGGVTVQNAQAVASLKPLTPALQCAFKITSEVRCGIQCYSRSLDSSKLK